MKRCYWLLCIVATVAVALLAVPTAEAACGSLIRLNSGAYPNQAYVQPAAAVIAGTSSATGANGSDHTGSFWQPGNRGAQSNGTFLVGTQSGCCANGDGWWTRYSSVYGWYFEANMTNSGVAGCPGGPAAAGGDENFPDQLIACIAELDSPNDDALYYCSRQTFAGTAAIQYGQGGDNATETWSSQDMAVIPRARLNGAVSRTDNDHTVELCWDDVNAGYQNGGAGTVVGDAYDTITAYTLCTAEAAANPGHDPSAWICGAGNAVSVDSVATAAGEQCATVTLSCSSGAGNANDLYLATQMEYDGGQYASEYVGKAIVIECDPNLADPQPTRQRGVRDVPTRRSR